MDYNKILLEYLSKVRKGQILIAVDGGTSAGKNHLMREFIKDHSRPEFFQLNVDDYAIDRKERLPPTEKYYNMKEWFDLDLLADHVKMIKSGVRELSLPTYIHKTGKPGPKRKVNLDGKEIFFLIGIFSLDQKIRDHVDLKIIVDAKPEIRLNRELIRNADKRSMDREFIIRRFKESEQPSFDKHYNEIKDHVDVVIDNNDTSNISFLKD